MEDKNSKKITIGNNTYIFSLADEVIDELTTYFIERSKEVFEEKMLEMMSSDDYISATEFCRHVEISKSTLTTWIQSGKIPADKYKRVGNVYKLNKHYALDLKKNGSMKGKHATKKASSEKEA